MKESEIKEHWKRILDTINDGVMLVRPDGVIVMVNRAFERMMGFPADEMIGKPCTLLNCDACEKDLKNGDDAWCALFSRGEDVRKRCLVMKKDGTYLQAIKHASLLRNPSGETIGAVETVTDISELERLDLELGQLSRRMDTEDGFHGMIGKSKLMQQAFEVIIKAAQSDAPVIIYGESGTGKELVAAALHKIGPRREAPFVQFNCAALNESLLESELFGHVKGAFTGAYKHRLGRFEAAHGGDIFLDEIGDLPLATQVKLLRVLELKQFERVGDHRSIWVDVRIITATNRDLETLIREKKFRKDLFFRINVIPIHLPPLRDRLEDIPLLVSTFIGRLRSSTGKEISGLTSEAMDRFMSYGWPGNVRELKSALEYAFVIAESGRITLEQLPPNIGEARKRNGTDWGREDPPEKNALIHALLQCEGNQTQAARMLGVNRVTVWNRIRKYDIDLHRLLST